MNTKRLSDKALTVIDQYLNFRVADAGVECAIPYFNNRRAGVRGGLRALTGKGSPKDIFDEVEITALKEKIDLKSFSNGSMKTSGPLLKQFLIDNHIGIDCSGFVYYVLNAESLAHNKGTIDRHLVFPFCSGILGKFKCKIRPVGNTDVITLAHDDNSRVIPLTDIQPGDMITMVKRPDAPAEERARDHIVVVHQVEYQNFVPTTIHYTHSIAWPSDGIYGHGVREGRIEIIDPKLSLIEQRWIEAEKIGEENYTFSRAKKSIAEIRRLKWF